MANQDLFGFQVKKSNGEEQKLSDYKGKVVLVVNVASRCGFTPQYEGLEELYKKYQDKGLMILGFPSNQFGSQEPGTNEEIQSFCKLNYGVTFPVFAKVDVNGDKADPLYAWLKSSAPGVLGTEAIKWNFTKFLIGRDGKVIDRFAPQTKPKDLEKDIEKALAAAK
ncbi:MAG: glutathione peroxidase [Bdellovibrionaceae bacterium]|nr:glutathione peroxidase [Pseudobdellovibrionaceae bacterium]MBX3032779.1 glutathione peroxidase [Pseudobdellovibrionaceae bacterium]